MPKKKDIWKQIIQILRSIHGTKHIDPWFFGTTLEHLTRKSAIIGVPNRFVAIWVKDNFLTDLERAFVKICGYRPKITCCYSKITSSEEQNDVTSPATPGIFQPLRPELSFDSFIVDNKNRFAHAAALSIAQAQHPSLGTLLLIYSPSTSGKTHLLHAIGNTIRSRDPKARIGYTNIGQLIGLHGQSDDNFAMDKLHSSVSELDILLLDDIHLVAGNREAEATLIFLCDTFETLQRPMVFASALAPTSMGNIDPHLSSRLQSGILAEIPSLERKTRFQIIKNKLAKDSVSLPEDILLYLLNLTDNLEELLSYCDKLARQITTQRRAIELSEIKRILNTPQSADISINHIQNSVAQYFGLQPCQLRSHTRERRVCHCKHVAMYLCKKILGVSLKEIGQAFGNMNHSSVLYGIRKIQTDIDNNSRLLEEIEKLENIITYC